MIDRIIKELFSIRMMTVGLVIFLGAIAIATFIESDYGTPASKIAVFNALWFEFLLLYLCINLIVNIFRYKLFRAEKAAVLAFHLSFIVIIIGAGLTRYMGFEGQMPIKEGQTSNVIFSADPYLVVKANDLVNQYELEEKRWLSEGYQNPFEHSFQLPGQVPVTVSHVDYQESIIDSIMIADSLKGEAIEFVVRGQNVYLFKGEEVVIGNMNFSFEKENAIPGIKIYEQDRKLYIQSIQPFERVDMSKLTVEDRQKNELDSSKVESIIADTAVQFYSGRLYMIGGESLVFREYRKNIGRVRMKDDKREDAMDILTVKLESPTEERIIEIPAGVDKILDPYYVSFAGLNFEIAYGSKPMEIPFSVMCRDFQLDRYPGSDMASSFASEVTVIDELNNKNFNQRIFMNNVMDYNGYRFFQSSYFPDESGTILSVNADWWGTNVTYLGYLLMTIGMALSLFAPKGRMRDLNTLIKKSRANRSKMMSFFAAALFVVAGQNAFAHDDHSHDDHTHDHEHELDTAETVDRSMFDAKVPEAKYLSLEDAARMDNLLVQDRDGRIIPFHTMSDRVLRKVHYSQKYNGKTAVQTLVSMHLYGPPTWKNEKIIYVSSKINGQLGVERYVSIAEVEDEHGNFKWIKEYTEAFEKPDARKNEFDKQLIKLGERYRVIKDVLNYQFFRVIPIPDDPRGGWAWPFALELKDKDLTGNNLAVSLLQELYAVSEGDKKFESANSYLIDLKNLQWEHVALFGKSNPSADLPSKSQIEAEIVYNDLNPFSWIKNVYFLLGFILILLFFARVLSSTTERLERIFKMISLPFIIAVFAFFILHGIGLGYRSYISGYAPWSNGYEAVIFIAWATVLAGIIFIKKNPAVLAATVLLSGLMLMVTEMNLLDPEITPLQPVLKSYWLMIHVAIITASYGFLGLAAILGLLNLILFLVRSKSNGKRITMNINELSAVNEMTMTVGLFMLTIGTFLGGIWANESWGRYWGWDPKETWALVSVLVYAVILHLRYIPGLNNRFLLNTVAFWGYSAILFTFFGVNFVLVGLHSYAQGDGVTEFPSWVIYTAIGFAVFNLISLIAHINYKKKKA
jgi:cytochrome c-type biogenesis protein CcsB